MAKQEEFKTDKGTYLFQHPGIRFSEQIKDDSKDRNGKFMPHRYYEESMKNVIVKPAVDYDYFDKLEGNKTETVETSGNTYELVYPETKTLSEMMYYFLNSRGVPSEVSTKEQLMKHIIKHDGQAVSYDFFDDNASPQEFKEVTDAASSFIQDTEFQKVMNAARRFLAGEEVS